MELSKCSPYSGEERGVPRHKLSIYNMCDYLQICDEVNVVDVFRKKGSCLSPYINIVFSTCVMKCIERMYSGEGMSVVSGLTFSNHNINTIVS